MENSVRPHIPMRQITADELHEFEEHGVVCLSGLFSAEWILRMASAIQAIEDDPSRILGREVDRRSFIGDQNIWKLLDDFRDFVYYSPASRIAGTFLQSSCVRLFQDQLFIKPKECKVLTPWHHDHTFFPIQGGPLRSLWIALSEIDPSNGALEFVRGSHKWPQRFKAVRPDFSPYFLESDFDEVPDIESNRSSYDIVKWRMSPGDVLVFDSLTLHGAGANSSTVSRNAYATRWCGDNVLYEPRHATANWRWKHGLEQGDRLRGPLFPQILPHTIESEFGVRRYGPEPPDPDLIRLNKEAYAAAEERKAVAAQVKPPPAKYGGTAN